MALKDIKIFTTKQIKELENHFTEKQIPKLKVGMFHTLFGDAEGVSIVMQQIENVLNNNLKIPRRNIVYLIGKSKINNSRITQSELLWNNHPDNLFMRKQYSVGYGGGSSERIEITINRAKKVIADWIKKTKIDVLIAHNTSHPVNFIASVALSRYYSDCIKAGKKTPKYILWWHDSHLERDEFLHPARDTENYLLQGVPGKYVEYTLFINSLQFEMAKKYFKKIDSRNLGFYSDMMGNHDIMYNTTDTFINNFSDLKSAKFTDRVDQFITDFKVRELFKKEKVSMNDVLFCLQHTRIVGRKRIDFALRYIFALLDELKKKGMYKAIYFLISGHNAGGDLKSNLIKLHKQLKKEYNTNKVFLVFAEDYYDKTHLTFEEYPKVFAKLGAISTYFSDVEGFGNNLLEVLASGLITTVYTYPVYKKDIAKYRLKVIDFNKFELDPKRIQETINVLKSDYQRKKWINYNLEILKEHFPHSTMAVKLKQAIISKRTHI
jgi:mannosylglucosylglycerate synthase